MDFGGVIVLNEERKKPRIILNATWNKESFKKVAYMCERKYGGLKRRGLIITLFSIIFVVFLFFLCSVFNGKYEMNFSTIWAPTCGIIFSLTFLYYYVMFFPNLIKIQAEKIFDSNKILKLPFKVSFFEDKFVYENKFETLTRYWTDILFCVETDKLFVIKDTGNIVLILEKSDLSEKEIEDTDIFLKNMLVNRYSRYSKI